MSGLENNIVYGGGLKIQPSSARDISDMQRTSSDVSHINYSGNPEGFVSANPSSFCHDTSSGNVYKKTSGTGNTGWQILSVTENSTPIGSLQYFSTGGVDGDTYMAPYWLKCDNSIYNQSDYPVLFDRIGLINPPGTSWTIGSAFTATAALIFDGSKFIALNQTNGSLRSTTDGINLNILPSPFYSTTYSLVFSGDLYVIGSISGQLATSTDALTWNSPTPSISPAAKYGGPALIYDGSKYVGLNGNSLLTSTDLSNFQTLTSTFNNTLQSIVYAAGVYVITANQGKIYTSTDLVTYSTSTVGTAGIVSCIYDGTNFIACCGTATTSGIITSTDGFTWNQQTVSSTQGICFSGSLYGAVASSGSSAYSSTDAVTWTNRPTGGSGTVAAIDYGSSLFVIANGVGMRTSTDMITWTPRTTFATSLITNVKFLNGQFLFCGQEGNLGTSTDGITWVNRASTVTYELSNLYYNSGIYICSGLRGLITSTDAITWTQNINLTSTTTAILSLAYGNSTYVYGGGASTIASSTDAISWSTQTSAITGLVQELIYGDKFVLTTNLGEITTSTDGVTWTAPTNTGISAITGLKFLNSIYIAGASNGRILTSTDGITWNTSSTSTTATILTVEYSKGFYSAQASQTGFQSTDAVNWYSSNFATATASKSSQGNGILLTSGPLSFVYSSDDYPYDEDTQFQLPNDNNLGITVESIFNFKRSLYIKAKQ